jgi:asparagine synthase (glutamine-hydrolysing)
MCGIVGGIAVEPFECLDQTGVLSRAVDSMAHRGPDDRGEFISEDRTAFLGHRRLSIIDLDGGHQPIVNESGSAQLCYNGEIYNFPKLRAELETNGHIFRTRTDGEPALHAYEEDPAGFVERLDGMFALAILDREKNSLTLARDRHGIKPLYYTSDLRRLIFASEVKAILTLLPEKPELDPAAVRAYLRWKYVPAPLTIYRGIRVLLPGLTLSAQVQQGQLVTNTRRYWLPRYQPPKLTDEAEAIELLDQQLRLAVRSHLEADVEVGALLSGGVDSSLVVAIAQQMADRPLRTFSVGFDEKGFDQLPEAKCLAEHCGTQHHEMTIRVDPLAVLPKLVRLFDQPFGDSSALACYHVCEVAAQHVKTVLTGDGGDESFAGYRRYADLRDALERPGRSWRQVGSTLGFHAGALLFSPEAKFLRRTRSARFEPLLAYRDREITASDWLIDRLLTPEYQTREPEQDAFDQGRMLAESEAGCTGAEVAQFIDQWMYLPEDILTKVDRTSMGWSLECRVPLLDHRVTSLAARLDPALRIHGREGKYLLKRVAERYVPHELLYRKKRGFRVPIRRWFKRDLLDHTAKLLRGGSLFREGVLDPRGVEWVLSAQRKSWMNLSSTLWSLLFMELWAREYRG